MSDWWCSKCDFKIFGRKDKCKKCGQKRPGGDVKSPSNVVKPGDWRCAVCDVNNFASRQACFKCRKLKPGFELRPPPQPVDVTVTQACGDCSICMGTAATHALTPCGHLCVCGLCTMTLMGEREPKCPICRGAITGHQRIFLSVVAQ